MTSSRRGTIAAFAAVTTLFFAWGFITSLIDPLVAAVKGIFDLTDVQAQLSASAFFIAYGLISMPAAVLVSRRRSVPSILIALGTMIAGCLVMLVAANLAIYSLVLLGLFILASGITILQVAANPLAAALGDPKYSHFRLTLSQTFNSVGTFIGPYLGAVLFLEGLEVKEGEVITQAVRDNALVGIDFAYFWLCGLIAMLLLFFVLARKTVEAAAPVPSATASSEVTALLRKIARSPIVLLGSACLIIALVAGSAGLLNSTATLTIGIVSLLAVLASMGLATGSRWALFGGLAIFLYVGGEVAIGTQMAFFLNSDSVWGASEAPAQIGWLSGFMQLDSTPGVSLQEAGKAVSLYWGGAMVGRIIGSALLARFHAAWLLAIFTTAAAVMCFYVFAIGGVAAGFVALSIGLFNSIMFPTIFTLTLERSTASQEATSGLLCTAIVGGAAIPPLVGLVSQSAGYATAFVVPMLCYVVLVVFAVAASRAVVVARDEPAAAAIH